MVKFQEKQTVIFQLVIQMTITFKSSMGIALLYRQIVL
ncbi:MAG: hypothetical protein ACI9O4_001473, partial [Chitinophagales bacterium]